MNMLFMVLPILIQFVDHLITGKKKGAIKKKTIMDAIMVAVQSGEIKLPGGLTPELATPTISLLVDMIFNMLKSTGKIK